MVFCFVCLGSFYLSATIATLQQAAAIAHEKSAEALQASVGRASLQRVTWTSSKTEAEAAKRCNTCRGHSKTCKPWDCQDCTMKTTGSSHRCGLFPLHQRLECFLESWSECQWVSMPPCESDIYQSSKAWALSQPSFTCLPNLRRDWSLERQGSNVAHVQMHTQDSMHTASSWNKRYNYYSYGHVWTRAVNHSLNRSVCRISLLDTHVTFYEYTAIGVCELDTASPRVHTRLHNSASLQLAQSAPWLFSTCEDRGTTRQW